MNDCVKFLDQPSFSLIGNVADQLGQECYVVGGFVRDKHLGRPIKMDLDFVTWVAESNWLVPFRKN